MFKKKVTSLLLSLVMIGSCLPLGSALADTDKNKRLAYIHAGGANPTETTDTSTVYMGENADVYFAVDNPNKGDFENDIHKVWDIVFAVDKYSSWRSDLSKTEIINEKQFIEYTKDGYATTFSITAVEPYRRWEFDMENSNMAGHWIGVFMAKGNKTQVDFTENVIPKKWFMKPFVKSYLRKHQKQFVLDLKKALE